MSRQQKEVGRILRVLFSDTQEEIPLEKITNNNLHKGIRVDFWIPSINLIIEVHGIQHYKPSGFGKDQVAAMEAYSYQVYRDSKLIIICKEYNINYMEIPHDHDVSFKDFLCYFGDDNES